MMGARNILAIRRKSMRTMRIQGNSVCSAFAAPPSRFGGTRRAQGDDTMNLLLALEVMFIVSWMTRSAPRLEALRVLRRR
jgi:hypothetical protein